MESGKTKLQEISSNNLQKLGFILAIFDVLTISVSLCFVMFLLVYV